MTGIETAAVVALTSLVSVLLTFWVQSRRANTADARLGLDSLSAGLEAANDELAQLRAVIQQLDAQAHKALTETNRWRLMHGFIPATDLKNFETLNEESWQEVATRIARTGGK